MGILVFTYQQKTGQFWDHNGNEYYLGYAGSLTGNGKNDPEKQHVRNVGPLPRGLYLMEEVSHHDKFKRCIRLVPEDESIMFNRDAFYIHGFSSKKPDDSSLGCPIMSKNWRHALCDLAASHTVYLKVIR